MAAITTSGLPTLFCLRMARFVSITMRLRRGTIVFFGTGAGNRTMTPNGGSAGLASYNVGIGYQALGGLTTGNQNVGIGELALTANTTGQQNLAVGNLAMVSNTTGSYNTAVGENALGNNTT